MTAVPVCGIRIPAQGTASCEQQGAAHKLENLRSRIVTNPKKQLTITENTHTTSHTINYCLLGCKTFGNKKQLIPSCLTAVRLGATRLHLAATGGGTGASAGLLGGLLAVLDLLDGGSAGISAHLGGLRLLGAELKKRTP